MKHCDTVGVGQFAVQCQFEKRFLKRFGVGRQRYSGVLRKADMHAQKTGKEDNCRTKSTALYIQRKCGSKNR
jgi:hypothetical protein